MTQENQINQASLDNENYILEVDYISLQDGANCADYHLHRVNVKPQIPKFD